MPGTHEWNRGPGKVQRIALGIDDDLHDARIVEIGRLVDPPAQRGDELGRPLDKRRRRRVDGLRDNQRLVSLDVHDDVGTKGRGDFGEPVGAGRVRRARHDRCAAESINLARDTLVIGGDENGIDAPRLLGAAAHVLDHCLVIDERKWLARQASRAISSGDDGDDSGGSEGIWQPSRKQNRHGKF